MEGLMLVSENSKPACPSSARPAIVSLSAAGAASAKMTKAGNAAALVRTERRESLGHGSAIDEMRIGQALDATTTMAVVLILVVVAAILT